LTTVTQGPAVGSRKKTTTIEQPRIAVPPQLAKWAKKVAAWNYITQKIERDPEDKTQWMVDVFIPKDVVPQKIDHSAGWFGHKIIRYSVVPVKKGTGIYATLGE
jgi:hypothetical protein